MIGLRCAIPESHTAVRVDDNVERKEKARSCWGMAGLWQRKRGGNRLSRLEEVLHSDGCLVLKASLLFAAWQPESERGLGRQARDPIA